MRPYASCQRPFMIPVGLSFCFDWPWSPQLEHRPKWLDALKALGGVLESRGDDEEAKEVFSRALAVDPRDEDVVSAVKRLAAGYESLFG